jgi:glycine/D-amino acid oxidase-like deaminating enzyme
VTVPDEARFVVIGAGVHGLSTAWHLAKELEVRGRGSGEDVIVLDKTGIGAGPSGIACGVIRNNYFQPAMRELMAHSVSVWESDPEAFHYHPVGYMQIAPEVMHADVAQIHEEQRAIGYPSELIEGEEDCRLYMQGLFDDWQAKNITAVLHEKKGGYAHNLPSLEGLAGKAEALGVQIVSPMQVEGLRVHGGGHRRVDRSRASSRASRWSSPPARGSGLLAHAGPPCDRAGEGPRREHLPGARCGRTGAWLRERWASIPRTSPPTTAGCLR